MSFEFRKWRKFLFESEESQEEYQLNFIFSIENKAGIDRTEIVKFIRGIENVTTVRKIREISRTDKSSSIEYSIRFVLPGPVWGGARSPFWFFLWTVASI